MKGTTTQKVVLRYLEGDKSALDELPDAIDGMVVSIVSKYKCKCDFDDLYQIAWTTIMKCLQTYKVESGVLFSTFCYKAIVNNVIMAENKERRHLNKYTKNGECIRSYISKDGCCKGTDLKIENAIPNGEWDISKRVIFDNLTLVVFEIANKYEGKKALIINAYLEGVRQTDIARKLNVSRAYVSKVVLDFIKRCDYELNR